MKVLARKMKNFKILAIFENFLKNFGVLNQNSGSTDIFALDWRTHSENLKVLAQKMKNFKILSIFDNFWKFFEKFWGPKSKFWSHRKFCFGFKNTFWNSHHSTSKTEGGVPK